MLCWYVEANAEQCIDIMQFSGSMSDHMNIVAGFAVD